MDPLTLGALGVIGLGTSAMAFIPGVDRAIGVSVETDMPLEMVDAVLEGGKEFSIPPPGEIGDQRLELQFSKTSGTATGTAGVIHLNAGNTKYTIMWSVPYDYNIYENWFDVVEGHESFKTVYYKAPTKGGQNLLKKGTHYIRGRMGNGGICSLMVSILKNAPK